MTPFEALHLARTKYREDQGVREWLRLYEHGVKRGRRYTIPPRCEFVLENLVKAVRLREEGKVFQGVVK